MSIGRDIDKSKLRESYLEESTKLRFQKALAKYAEIVVNKNTKTLTNDEIAEVCKVWTGKPDQINIMRFRRIMSVPEIKQKGDLAIIQLLNAAKLDEKSAIDMLDEVLTFAREAKNGDLMLKIHDRLVNYHGLLPEKTKVTETREYEQHQLTENAEKALQESKTARAKQVTESTKQG